MISINFSRLFVLKLIYILVMLKSVVNSLEVKAINASLGNVYKHEIAQGQKYIFVYNITEEEMERFGMKQFMQMKTAFRVICNAEHFYDPECPLILSVTQKKSVIFWDISSPTEPYNLTINGSVTSHVERSICLNETSPEDMFLTMELSTCSKTPVKFSISSFLRNDLQIPTNKLTRTQITPTSPEVYYFPPNEFGSATPEFLFLQLTSRSSSCMIMSVQQPYCPISDTVETLTSHGLWQTVSTKTGMTIPTADFPQGFFVVFILLTEDSSCNHPSMDQHEVGISSENFPNASSHQIRRKTIHFAIREEMPTAHYLLAILIPLGLFLTFISLIFIVHWHFHKIRCDLYKKQSTSINTIIPPIPYDSVEMANQRTLTMGSTDSILRSRIQISELINSKPERLMIQSKRYYMAGILVASFYCVPVFQLILSYHRRLKETGNLDLCYFNFMCSHMWGMFHDFNQIYSNIGYIICGPVFMFIVYLRQVTVEKNSINSGTSPLSSLEVGYLGASEKIENSTQWIPRVPWDISKGVFVHHGLFYAMGFSLFMTGVMSSAYHICPNQNNFQFDAVQQQLFAAVGVVTIYQFRHPTYVSASMTFLTLAVVAASTVVGLLWESNKFRLFFTVLHITFLLVILVYIHYVGYIRVNGVTITEWRNVFSILKEKWTDDLRNFRFFRFQQDVWTSKTMPRIIVLPGPCRLIFPILVISVNFAALAMIWTWMSTTNFASQVLAVYVINFSVYSVYYAVMKAVHYECKGRLWIQPAFYSVLTIVLWMWSLSYFGDVVTLWERSPAESRATNAECIFLGFYDSHSCWHYISAAALFTSLMSLLTMDDDLMDRSKSEIPVF